MDADSPTSRRRYESWRAALLGARETPHARLTRRLSYERLRRQSLGRNWRRSEIISEESADDTRRCVALDVERLPSDDPRRTSPECVAALKRILVTYASMTKSRKGYRQGMHELASMLFDARARAADYSKAPEGRGKWGETNDHTAFAICADDEREISEANERDYRFVEHDTFAMFEAFMGETTRADDGRLRLGVYYEDTTSTMSPINAAFRRIENALVSIDEAVARKLAALEVEPQLYLLRWLRLGYGREFHREDVCALWDAFMECVVGKKEGEEVIKSRDIYEGVAVSLLLSMREDILCAQDFGTAMSRLQKVPPGLEMEHIIARAKAMAMTGLLDEHGFGVNPITLPSRKSSHRRVISSKNRLVVPSIRNGKSPSVTSETESLRSLNDEELDAPLDVAPLTTSGVDTQATNLSFVDAERVEEVSPVKTATRQVESMTLRVPKPVTSGRYTNPNVAKTDAGDDVNRDGNPFTGSMFAPDPPRSFRRNVVASEPVDKPAEEPDHALETSRENARRHLNAAINTLNHALEHGNAPSEHTAKPIDTVSGQS
jgi:hypothetical protein